MKKIPVNLKIIPIVLAIPLLLTSCEELTNIFGDSSSREGYNANYSSPAAPTNNKTTPVNSVNDEGTKHSAPTVKGIPASQSETAATTVSTPVSTEKKTATGTVDAPAVPSQAPTVDQ